MFYLIATGFDSHNNKHPAAFLLPPPPSFTGNSTQDLSLAEHLDGKRWLSRKTGSKKHDVNHNYERHAFGKRSCVMLLGVCQGLQFSLPAYQTQGVCVCFSVDLPASLSSRMNMQM
ncbi:uncharacterized [Lates japonicus]